MSEYVVNVGNIGNVECKNKKEALEVFKDYVEQSKSGRGRAAGESVYVLEDGEPIKEYIGTYQESKRVMSKAREFLKINEGFHEVTVFKATLQKTLNELDDISGHSTNQEFLEFNKKVMSTIRGFLDPSTHLILKK
jgi:hypothetical protein